MGSPDPAAPVLRQPALAMAVNGTRLPGLVSFTVNRSNYFAADSFSASIALDATQDTSWAAQDTIELDLLVGTGGALQRVLLGRVDTVALDLARRIATLTGRDYASLLIEAKTAEKFLNLTGSQIVQTLAARHGLQAQVTATSTPAGKYYDTDHAQVTNEVSEWTLLTNLAQREGYDVFVEGRTLFFQPTVDPSSTAPYALQYDASGVPQANVMRLGLQRSLTLARDVIVKVISWNHENKAAITATRRATKTAGGSGAPATYTFREPGLTQAQADALADARLHDLTLHERRITATLPGDVTLTPRSVLNLAGTGTDFDQRYLVGRIHYSCTPGAGFVMRVDARNSSPHSVSTS